MKRPATSRAVGNRQPPAKKKQKKTNKTKKKKTTTNREGRWKLNYSRTNSVTRKSGSIK